MSNFSTLRERLQATEAPAIKGHWRPISACLDEDAGEYLNVGVMFQYGGRVEVRMLDTFDRVKCLYGNRIDLHGLSHLMMDIEDTIRHSRGDLPSDLSSTIRLGQPLFASGDNPESVVDEFFFDVVTLGMPSKRTKRDSFRYRSSHKVRETVFDIMRQRMAMQADSIIRTEPFRLKLHNSSATYVDIPLLSETAAGTIVSAWYKSHLVVENNLLQAASDLLLITSNSDRRKTALSVLVPGAESGMSSREFQKHQDTTYRLLERFRNSGIDVLTAPSSDALASETIEWWSTCAA